MTPLDMTEREIRQYDMVETIKGAKFRGQVRSIFDTRRGNPRCVVEAVHPDFEETLHLYPLSQLRIIWE